MIKHHTCTECGRKHDEPVTKCPSDDCPSNAVAHNRSMSNEQYLTILNARKFIGATNSGSTEHLSAACTQFLNLTVLLCEGHATIQDAMVARNMIPVDD